MLSVAQRLAQEENNHNQNGFSYFRLKEGEEAILRFLTPMVDMVEVNHVSAGCECHIEIPKDQWDSTIAKGEQVVCQVCGKPFTDSDIVGVKEGAAGGQFHFIRGANRSVWCLNDPDNQQPYSCPLCEQEVEKEFNGRKYMGKNTPSPRLYGYAVVREAEIVKTTDQRGMPLNKVVGIKDKMIENNGQLVPQVVMVNQAYGNFWKVLNEFDSTYCNSITYYDWQIKRIDSRTYQIERVNQEGNIVDIALYKPFMTRSLTDLVAGMGTPQVYTNLGIAVPGFNQQPNATPGYTPNAVVQQAQTAQNVLQQAAQSQPVVQNVQPQQTMVQPITQAQQAPAQSVQTQPVQAQPVQQMPPQTDAEPASGVHWTDVAKQNGVSVYNDGVPF